MFWVGISCLGRKWKFRLIVIEKNKMRNSLWICKIIVVVILLWFLLSLKVYDGVL